MLVPCRMAKKFAGRIQRVRTSLTAGFRCSFVVIRQLRLGFSNS